MSASPTPTSPRRGNLSSPGRVASLAVTGEALTAPRSTQREKAEPEPTLEELAEGGFRLGARLPRAIGRPRGGPPDRPLQRPHLPRPRALLAPGRGGRPGGCPRGAALPVPRPRDPRPDRSLPEPRLRSMGAGGVAQHRGPQVRAAEAPRDRLRPPPDPGRLAPRALGACRFPWQPRACYDSRQ
jgi:hypothetical protein